MSREKLINIAENIKDEDINFDDIPELTNEDIKKSIPLYEAPEILELLIIKRKKLKKNNH
ncbi:hypothetical protein [Francisella philomiragia]|uniref:hypothetical protein n=1 Tax=Francisella philomiragia TaxID=28110 RepID=UPI001B8CC7F1|nr:hypothetical protein [Francisella philomiragia]QUE32406.1 hypothetical protein IMS64_09705 [Francisella philomiragia]